MQEPVKSRARLVNDPRRPTTRRGPINAHAGFIQFQVSPKKRKTNQRSIVAAQPHEQTGHAERQRRWFGYYPAKWRLARAVG